MQVEELSLPGSSSKEERKFPYSQRSAPSQEAQRGRLQIGIEVSTCSP